MKTPPDGTPGSAIERTVRGGGEVVRSGVGPALQLHPTRAIVTRARRDRMVYLFSGDGHSCAQVSRLRRRFRFLRRRAWPRSSPRPRADEILLVRIGARGGSGAPS